VIVDVSSGSAGGGGWVECGNYGILIGHSAVGKSQSPLRRRMSMANVGLGIDIKPKLGQTKNYKISGYGLKGATDVEMTSSNFTWTVHGIVNNNNDGFVIVEAEVVARPTKADAEPRPTSGDLTITVTSQGGDQVSMTIDDLEYD
jgi:hypothetical protein